MSYNNKNTPLFNPDFDRNNYIIKLLKSSDTYFDAIRSFQFSFADVGLFYAYVGSGTLAGRRQSVVKDRLNWAQIESIGDPSLRSG